MRREQKRSTFSRAVAGKSPPNMSTVWDGMSLVSFCFATVHTGQRKVQRGRTLICCCSCLHSFLLFFVIEILFVVAESERAIDGARHPRSACSYRSSYSIRESQLSRQSHPRHADAQNKKLRPWDNWVYLPLSDCKTIERSSPSLK